MTNFAPQIIVADCNKEDVIDAILNDQLIIIDMDHMVDGWMLSIKDKITELENWAKIKQHYTEEMG